MAFVWQDKQNGVDDILAEHINDVAHEVIRLEKDKVNKDLSNVEDVVFKNKATSAGVAGKVSSVNGKIGEVHLSASDVQATSADEVEDLINSTNSSVVFPRFRTIETEIDNIVTQILPQKADKAQEIFEEDLDGIILTNNQPKLFKVSKTSIGMISAFNPYYVYYGEISPLVDGKSTHLYQYKITGTGIYFRTGTRQPISPEQSWQEWTKIGSGDGGGAVSSVNGKVGDVVLSANDVEAYSQIPGINITGRGIEIHSFSDKNIILFTHRDDGSFAVHDLSQKADKATTLSGYGITDAYTIDETDGSIMSHYNVVVKPEITKKADKASILITSESSLILTHNQEARLGEIATLTLSMPTAIDDLYWSSFCFASGETATSISYSGEPIIWCGDDCDADGSFIPESNTKYEVHIKKLGADIVARVGAY